MDIVFVLLPLALVLVGIAVAGFVWAVKRGQFDDMKTPAMRAVLEERPQTKN